MTMLPAGTLSKVPEVTLGFWVIKVLATTLGETGGDAAPPRSFPTRPIAASRFPITSAPIVTATRSSACSAASKPHAAFATRYDKCARNFLSAVCLIAAIYFWLN
jgi:hypothetical protein